MNSISITLPDGSQRTYPAGVTAQKIASDIGKRLEEAAVAAKVNGKLVDLNSPINADAQLAIVTKDSKEGLEVIRHSTAHLLAMAVKELFPETQVTIGPVTEDGFYYDFDRTTAFAPEELAQIEKKMEEIAARKLEVQRKEWKKSEIIPLFQKMNEHFKVEIIESIPDTVVSTYHQGNWVDLCRGPHVPNTSKLGKFKLLSVAGAYWRGDEKNKMLSRIYGTAFATQKELDEHLHRLEEAKKRDHRNLGPEMELFAFLPIAPAMPFFLPKGTQLYQTVAQYMRHEMANRGYDEVMCPQLMSTELWKKSGHLDYYRENMYLIDSGEGGGVDMALKPMNCPGHASLYATTKHSYRELPIRFAEFTKLHRFERRGVTHGILRTRTFAQDDAHIFCSEEQILTESKAVISHTYEVYKKFGFDDVLVMLATRPAKFAGTIDNWDKAIAALETSLSELQIPFEYNPGEGAFYGPKIEFHIRDSLKRLWQCGTIQVDFSTPARFSLEYTDTDGKMKTPVMIHRAILGSFERFLGILIEHHAGHLPLWVAPVQLMLINVTDAQLPYTQRFCDLLKGWGYRVETDPRNEKLGYKIREAQLKRIPFMAVAGNKEMESGTISLRRHTGEMIPPLNESQLKEFLEQEIAKPVVGHH